MIQVKTRHCVAAGAAIDGFTLLEPCSRASKPRKIAGGESESGGGGIVYIEALSSLLPLDCLILRACTYL